MAFRVDPPSKPPIYAFYKQFCKTGCAEGSFTLLQSVQMELEYQHDVYGVTNSAHIRHL
jgi:hypothetical protein